MSETDPQNPESPEDEADASPDPELEVEAAAAEGLGASDDVEALQTEVAALKERLLRAMADSENIRRRAEREKSDAAKFGIASFARDLLSVADNLSRAIASAPESADAEAFKTLITGVQMTETDLLAVLSRHGVARIEPKGERFDPNLHQAVAEVPGSGEPAGVVVDVAQPGFVIGERVLRAAMVTVSNGKGAAAPASDDASDAPGPPPGGAVDTTA